MLIITITDSDKSVDEEEYMFFRMNREKMAGENLREGNMEVAFELWIERDRAGSDTPGRIPSRLQRRFHRYQGKRYRKTERFSRIVQSAEVSSEFRWYHGL